VFYFLGQVANPGSGNVTFTDNFIPDADLVTTVIAPLNHLNDPPPAGMTVMCYWQGRIWGAVGSKLYFNAGPDCVNGIPEQAWPPANVFSYSGPINRVTRTSQGVLVWGSDYISMALGGPQTLSFYPYDLLEGIGVNSPNCTNAGRWTFLVSRKPGITFSKSSRISRITTPISQLIDRE
jgi:hypothetical protein